MYPARLDSVRRSAAQKVAAVFVLFFGLVLAASSALAGESGVHQFENWMFSLLSFDSGERFIVIRTRDLKSKDVELQLFKQVGRCGKTYMRIVLLFPQTTTKGVDSKDVSGEMRCDNAPLHKTISDIELPEGKKTGFISVKSFENPGSLIPEMENGQVVRFRFLVGQKENFQRFSLSGFRQAFETMRLVCAKAEAAREAKRQAPPPRHKAQPQPQGKESDAEYFILQPPSSSGKKSDKDFF